MPETRTDEIAKEPNQQLAIARPAVMIQAATKDHQLTLTVQEAVQLRDQLDAALRSLTQPENPPSKTKTTRSRRAKKSPAQSRGNGST